MEYTIYRIFDDDYGCEERPDDAPEMVILLLRNQEGEERLLRVEESLLLSMGLDEGCSIQLSESGLLITE